MAEYLIKGATLKGIAEAIRGKTGGKDPIAVSAMAAQIESITGSGSSADVRHVTFMSYDGSVEYLRLPVAVGYDCQNPKIDTPAKPSTAQYSYTFAGWATEANGALDANALKAVDEDRTVFAAFASVLRYYTISYLDTDGSVLKTESLPYGASISYIPQKQGYTFAEWSPAATIVNKDITYTAVWTEQVSFANSMWADIVAVAESGNAPNVFAVGDTRTMNLGFCTATVMILGFNHDELADGSGKAGISIGMMETTTTSTKCASDGSGYRGNENILNRFTADI
jgi:hypothetical protein